MEQPEVNNSPAQQVDVKSKFNQVCWYKKTYSYYGLGSTGTTTYDYYEQAYSNMNKVTLPKQTLYEVLIDNKIVWIDENSLRFPSNVQ